jgi:hypothetical protein
LAHGLQFIVIAQQRRGGKVALKSSQQQVCCGSSACSVLRLIAPSILDVRRCSVSKKRQPSERSGRRVSRTKMSAHTAKNHHVTDISQTGMAKVGADVAIASGAASPHRAIEDLEPLEQTGVSALRHCGSTPAIGRAQHEAFFQQNRHVKRIDWHGWRHHD